MENEQLQQAIGLVQSGDKTGAIKILKEIITKEPKNENAWLWLAACFDQPDNKVRSLQKVLEINPNNEKAKQALYKLTPTEPSLADIVPNASAQSVRLPTKSKPQMEFLKDLLRNLAFLIAIGIVLYIIAPDMMKQVFQLYGMLFGPIAILLVIVAAVPRKKRSKRYRNIINTHSLAMFVVYISYFTYLWLIRLGKTTSRLSSIVSCAIVCNSCVIRVQLPNNDTENKDKKDKNNYFDETKRTF